jgi:pyruvate ferredoxin oxidoreductase alpha subunit
MKNTLSKKQLLEGSRAIALTIKNIGPNVVSAYPITPQTHIVEDLAQFKADGDASYEYLRAESEFAAASIVLGASATGVRVYSATSSQGLILMLEVIYNIAGLELPVVMTVANRAISAPINIWNDHSDAMAMRDAGWIMLFAENHQEAVNQHILAYKLAESLSIPVTVNVDGFILTHSYDSVVIPAPSLIKKFLPGYKPVSGQYLDPAKPITIGGFFGPEHFFAARQKLADKINHSALLINKEFKNWLKIFPDGNTTTTGKTMFDNGLVEYYGPAKINNLIVAMGSMAGTIKEVIDNDKAKKTGLLKIKSYRPFPENDLKKMAGRAKNIIVIEKALGYGAGAPLYSDVCTALKDNHKKIISKIVGLGGQDVTANQIKSFIK